ncbi:MAG: TetR/AcrR family transcriptional regulator [Chitinophagales bacterium]
MVTVAFYSKQKQTILTQTHSLFAKHGIQTLTLDDISKQTKIPLAEIHEHFTNKDALVEQSLHNLFAGIKKENEFIKEFYMNPLDKLVYSAYNLMCQLFKFGSDFFYDLKRYFPDIFREYREFVKQHFFAEQEEFIQESKNKGLILSSIKSSFIFELFSKLMNALLFENNVSKKQNFIELFYHAIILKIRNFLTNTGEEVLSKNKISYLLSKKG